MKKVKIYTAEPCGYCRRAKELLKSQGIAFEEEKVSWDDEAKWEVLAKKSGMKTMPMIFLDEECIGGYSELSFYMAQGKLAEMLNN